MTNLLAPLMLMLVMGCHVEGQGPVQSTEKQASSDEKGMTVGQPREFLRRAIEVAGEIKDYGKPRVVQRGANPELIIHSSEISFNGKPLKLGAHIDEWKKVFGASPRSFPKHPTSYVWDDLGIEIVTEHEQVTKVVQLTVYLNQKPKDPYAGMVTVRPDGSPIMPLPDFNPKNMFRGYFELDGAGIDRQTKVWEVNALAKRRNKFYCMMSLNSCHAATEDNRYTLDFSTDNRKGEGLIYVFTLGD
jgi:hypothetical protein